jgi:hypothetical protein
MFALLVDDTVNEVYGAGQYGQRCYDVQCKQWIYPNHVPDADKGENNKVGGIHYGRSCVHSDPANVFTHSVHQVACKVGFEEVSVQLLVVLIYLVLLIILDEPAHDYDGLPHKEHENAAQQRQTQEQYSLKQHEVDHLGLSSRGERAFGHLTLNLIKHIADNASRHSSKEVGYGNK